MLNLEQRFYSRMLNGSTVNSLTTVKQILLPQRSTTGVRKYIYLYTVYIRIGGREIHEIPQSPMFLFKLELIPGPA